MLAGSAGDFKYAWCVDFLRDGAEFGIDGVAGCCDKDERLFLGWCMEANASSHPLYGEACEVKYGLTFIGLLFNRRALSAFTSNDVFFAFLASVS